MQNEFYRIEPLRSSGFLLHAHLDPCCKIKITFEAPCENFESIAVKKNPLPFRY